MYAHNMLNLVQHIHGKEKADGFFPSVKKALESGEEGDIIVRLDFFFLGHITQTPTLPLTAHSMDENGAKAGFARSSS